jgi:hypothetical protein
MGYISDYILPNGGDKDRPDGQKVAGLAAYERENGRPATTRDYTHWHNGRLVRSTLF